MVKRAVVLLILLSSVGFTRALTKREMRDNAIKINALEIEKVIDEKKAAVVEELPKRVTLNEDKLYFDFDKSEVKAEYNGELREIVNILQKNNLRVGIRAYTDSKGGESYNIGLSQRRAEAVKARLLELGLEERRITEVRGLGSSNPVAANKNADGSDNPRGRALNRRVEFELVR